LVLKAAHVTPPRFSSPEQPRWRGELTARQGAYAVGAAGTAPLSGLVSGLV